MPTRIVLGTADRICGNNPVNNAQGPHFYSWTTFERGRVDGQFQLFVITCSVLLYLEILLLLGSGLPVSPERRGLEAGARNQKVAEG